MPFILREVLRFQWVIFLFCTVGRLREKTQQQLDLYARQGLRILVMAKRSLNPTEYTDWWARHQEIEMSLENRERRLRESFAKLESNLTLLGATGIEDRLQEGVPEAIASLLSAGENIDSLFKIVDNHIGRVYIATNIMEHT